MCSFKFMSRSWLAYEITFFTLLILLIVRMLVIYSPLTKIDVSNLVPLYPLFFGGTMILSAYLADFLSTLSAVKMTGTVWLMKALAIIFLTSSALVILVPASVDNAVLVVVTVSVIAFIYEIWALCVALKNKVE